MSLPRCAGCGGVRPCPPALLLLLAPFWRCWPGVLLQHPLSVSRSMRLPKPTNSSTHQCAGRAWDGGGCRPRHSERGVSRRQGRRRRRRCGRWAGTSQHSTCLSKLGRFYMHLTSCALPLQASLGGPGCSGSQASSNGHRCILHAPAIRPRRCPLPQGPLLTRQGQSSRMSTPTGGDLARGITVHHGSVQCTTGAAAPDIAPWGLWKARPQAGPSMHLSMRDAWGT